MEHSLDSTKKSFIELMTHSDEHARHGFKLLAKYQNPDHFFDALREKGLFKAEHNPAPVPAGENLVQVPYWGALTYLVECAKLSDTRHDLPLATKVLEVVRDVSAYRDPSGGIRDNYHTFREFAEILGLVPVDALQATDIDLIPIWLTSRFDSDGLAAALDEGVLRRLLASERSSDWTKAATILRSCIAIKWRSTPSDSFDSEQPFTPIDAYWLHELLAHHARDLGRRAGLESTGILRQAVSEIFARGSHATWSYIFRAAVEDHAQNTLSDSVSNCVVEGLREALLGWIDAEAAPAKLLVAELLRSDVEMLRRIGIFALNGRWPDLRELYLGVVGPELFTLGHIHELYNLLKDRFEVFDKAQKDATLEAIGAITARIDDTETAANFVHQQLRWMTALSATTYQPALNWLTELRAESEFAVSDHPDFNSYTETFSGPGPSPFQIPDLVAFTKEGSIAEKLVSFKGRLEWRGPTREGLAEALGDAVQTDPEAFLSNLPLFLEVPASYQNTVINRFKGLWDTSKGAPSALDWDRAWPRLFAFFEAIGARTAAQRETRDQAPDEKWVEPSIADFLRASSSDEHVYPEPLLGRGWSILESMLGRTTAATQSDENPMDQAINTPRGRVIEALFAHVLRECRIADKSRQGHREAWKLRCRLFDQQLTRCTAANFEFSTLCGAYIANLDYMDAEWLRENIHGIFPAEHLTNFYSAVGGLTYAPSTRRLYVLLRDEGVLDRALPLDLSGREMRKQFIERVGLGYLWNEDELGSSRFSFFFDNSKAEDLEGLCWLFRRLRKQEVTETQITRVIAFWEACVAWARTLPSMPKTLMSRLSDLTSYLSTASGRGQDLLSAVAPYVSSGHGAHYFFEELHRLLDAKPSDAVVIDGVLQRVIDSSLPSYDYQDALRSLVKKFAESGRRPSALAYCERLRMIPGLASLFNELTRGSSAAVVEQSS